MTTWSPGPTIPLMMRLRLIVAFRVNTKLVGSFCTPASMTLEKGCPQFDVATDPERPNEVFLYEIYSDHSAFNIHLKTTHFAAFDMATAQMITRKEVRTYSQVRQ